MILQGAAADLYRSIEADSGGLPPLPPVKRQMLDYQMAALFVLAKRYDRPGARILEVGTGQGGSGYVLSRAAPQASVLSLTTSPNERRAAEAFWRAQKCDNVACLVVASWDFLASTVETYDLVFVDGDHNRIARDLPWFDRLKIGGLLLCHDYSPQDSRSPSRIVYEKLNEMATALGRPLDVRVVDDEKIGMAGFYRRSGESVVVAPTSPTAATGIVLRREDAEARAKAAAARVGLIVADDWTVRWPRTLFVSPETRIPWDVVSKGFDLLSRWDVAAPLSGALAESLGTDDDRDRTRARLFDLRIPAYHPGLVFVRASGAGPAWLSAWRDDCTGGDEALAMLRALATTKPRFCALPRVWTGTPAERAAVVPPRTIPRVRVIRRSARKP